MTKDSPRTSVLRDAELIESLRLWNRDDAADRIEALTEQLAAAQHDAKEAEAYAEEVERELRDTQDRANAFATKEYYTEMRAERAEAKLAKALEAMEDIKRYSSCGDTRRKAIETLAEIKGESHD